MQTFTTTTIRTALAITLDWLCDHGHIYSFAYNMVEAAWKATY